MRDKLTDRQEVKFHDLLMAIWNVTSQTQEPMWEFQDRLVDLFGADAVRNVLKSRLTVDERRAYQQNDSDMGSI